MEQPSSKALFTPAKTQRASEAIYNQIYPKIISGELRPGDRLPPERELAEMFQRSRPVVREALRMLQQEGLIGTAVGSSGGAVIRGVSLKPTTGSMCPLFSLTTGAVPFLPFLRSIIMVFPLLSLLIYSILPILPFQRQTHRFLLRWKPTKRTTYDWFQR